MPSFEENIDNPHKSKFWSDNTNLRSLDQNLLIPIIKSEILPEKETGIWRNINPTEVPNKPFFILFEDNIFGPFITKTKINNVEVTPYFNTILGIPQNTISTIKLELLEKNNFILEANINNKKKIFNKLNKIEIKPQFLVIGLVVIIAVISLIYFIFLKESNGSHPKNLNLSINK